MFPLLLLPGLLCSLSVGFQLFMVRTMAESLSSAELFKQLKSLGMEKLWLVVKKFLRQSYAYPTLLNFGGKPIFIFCTVSKLTLYLYKKKWFAKLVFVTRDNCNWHFIPRSFTCYLNVLPVVTLLHLHQMFDYWAMYEIHAFISQCWINATTCWSLCVNVKFVWPFHLIGENSLHQRWLVLNILGEVAN